MVVTVSFFLQTYLSLGGGECDGHDAGFSSAVVGRGGGGGTVEISVYVKHAPSRR